MEESDPVLWKTGAAAVVALVVWAIVSSIVSILSALGNLLTTDLREGVIDFWAQFIGGGVGVYSARVVCDKFLKPYSKHVIFMLFLVVCIGIVVIQFYMLHYPLVAPRMIAAYANGASSIAIAYIAFWKNEPLIT